MSTNSPNTPPANPAVPANFGFKANEKSRKQFDKNTFPSNLRGRKLEICYELKSKCGVAIGDIIKAESDLECNSIFGDTLGVDTPFVFKQGEIALLLAVAYDAHIKRSVLVLAPAEDHFIYFVYDEIPSGFDFSTLVSKVELGLQTRPMFKSI